MAQRVGKGTLGGFSVNLPAADPSGFRADAEGRVTIYDKTGKAYKLHAVDAKEWLAGGGFSLQPPGKPAKTRVAEPEPEPAVSEPAAETIAGEG